MVLGHTAILFSPNWRDHCQRFRTGTGYSCHSCRGGSNLDFYYLVSPSKGGANNPSNIRIFCQTCARERELVRDGIESSPAERKGIPDRVKLYVWRRDQGQCVKCGSKVKLEYDHIIPWVHLSNCEHGRSKCPNYWAKLIFYDLRWADFVMLERHASKNLDFLGFPGNSFRDAP